MQSLDQLFCLSCSYILRKSHAVLGKPAALGIPVEEQLINTCLSPPALTMAMMMFSEAIKGNS